MMNRREFLRASALIAAGTIAADQLEILDRLAPRRLFAGWSAPERPFVMYESYSSSECQMIPDGGYEAIISCSAPRQIEVLPSTLLALPETELWNYYGYTHADIRRIAYQQTGQVYA